MRIKIQHGKCYLWRFGNDLDRDRPNFTNGLDPNTSIRELKDSTAVSFIRACDNSTAGGWVLIRVVDDGDVGWVRCGWLDGNT